MRLIPFLLIFLLWSEPVTGQQFAVMEIPFVENEMTLINPYIGGLRAPQFSTADLDFDGSDDIVIFDREGNVFIPILKRSNGELEYAPQYRSIFPKARTWALFRDFNADGIKDIFCGPVETGLPAVEVYRGQMNEGILSYELVRFPERDFDVLYFPVGTIETPVFVGVIDLPDIRDVDSDGDLDILAFDPSGSTIYQYRNMAVEEGFTLDTLIFILEENCYGGVVESGFSQEVTLSTTPGSCGSSVAGDDPIASARHSGSTVLSIDFNHDGLLDMLLGDISYESLVALINGGTTEQAHFTEQIAAFPEENPAQIELFLGAFHENIDDDAERELIVTPNDRTASQTSDHIWIYDTHSENPDSFVLGERNFLLDQTVYPGTHTFPVFVDVNSDGLMDLIIGTAGKNSDGISKNPTIVLYQNTGISTEPIFTLSNSDYLGMSAFNTTSSIFAPAMGDLDGDGDLDMLIGDNVGSLYFLNNSSGDANVLNLDPPIYRAFDIKVGAHARPFIYDFNNDGLGDIILGEQNFNLENGEIGSLNYFQNLGTIGNPQFDNDETQLPNTSVFGKVNVKSEGFLNNYSAPALLKSKDQLYLASGSESGMIYFYNFNAKSATDSFQLISDQLGIIREGFRSSISFADIDSDNMYEMAVGSSRGGIAIYKTNLEKDIGTSIKEVHKYQSIHVFPNPSYQTISLGGIPENVEQVKVVVYSLTGQVALTMKGTDLDLNVENLKDGIYLIIALANDKRYISKFVKVSN